MAFPVDLAQIRTLLADTCDAAVVPSPALLAEALERRLVRVAESSGELVGCVAAEMPSPGHVRLSVIAVRAGMRRNGVAARLLAEMLRQVPQRSGEPPPVSAIANTEQPTVTRLLLACGFIGTRVMHPSGTDDALPIHFQHTTRVEYAVCPAWRQHPSRPVTGRGLPGSCGQGTRPGEVGGTRGWRRRGARHESQGVVRAVDASLVVGRPCALGEGHAHPPGTTDRDRHEAARVERPQMVGAVQPLTVDDPRSGHLQCRYEGVRAAVSSRVTSSVQMVRAAPTVLRVSCSAGV
ncbi:GNAT family N-acetyltransferase [Streptomyces sp. NPDC020792]|uniref:GNAT family N-acetyltransferase n=1 Tax=Streptomyces sp. NPDC020792 TaxID=3365089 RepID=UPI0037A7C7BC